MPAPPTILHALVQHESLVQLADSSEREAELAELLESEFVRCAEAAYLEGRAAEQQWQLETEAAYAESQADAARWESQADQAYMEAVEDIDATFEVMSSSSKSEGQGNAALVV